MRIRVEDTEGNITHLITDLCLSGFVNSGQQVGSGCTVTLLTLLMYA